ncbi:DUF2201 family putative metallopeptidase [Caldisericum sp.]|uniref:DUF2201 family putative metallopeptidase n=1 Tax=Caldisericum sp. TaxID=2499687 RepID=UPI003D0C66AB
MENIFEVLSPALRLWATKNLDVVMTDDIQTAGVCVENKRGFVLYVNPEWFGRLTSEQKEYLLRHEISHVFRGDVLRPHDADFKLWNVVADAVINHQLGEDIAKEMDGIVYTELASQLGLPTQYVASEYSMLQALKEKADATEKLFEQSQNLGEVLPSEELDAETRAKVLKGILEGRDIPDNEMSQPSLSIGSEKGTESRVYSEPKRLAIIRKILRVALSEGNTFQKTRSYMREGVVDGIKGVHRKRIGKIFLCVDTSGSIDPDVLKSFIGIGYWLSRNEFIADWGSFSDEFYLYRTPIKGFADLRGVGGGTRIAGLFDFLRKNKYDAVIILTDGEIFDYAPSLGDGVSAKIVWMLTYDNQDFKEMVPKKDQVFILEGKR